MPGAGNGRDVLDEVGNLVTQIEQLVRELRRLLEEDEGGSP